MNDAISTADNRAASHVEQRRGKGKALFLQIHRLVGLIAGAVFAVIGLSGSFLAYREAIDETLNAALMRVERPDANSAYKPLDEIVAAATAAMPPEGKLERLTTPRHAGAAAAITYMVETDDLDTYVYEMFVDPYTARVKGQRLLQHADDPLSQPLVQIIMTFHWTLLLGVNNAWIVGFLGVALICSLLIGLYLWWPANGNWRLGLTVKWGATPERVVYDLHRSVGAYCAAFLLIILLTGVAMIFKPATRSFVSLFSPVRADPDYGKSVRGARHQPIGASEAAAVADKAFPDGRLHWILFPSTPTAVYVIGKQSDGEPNQSKTNRNVGVEQYTGEITTVQDRSRFTASETFLEWLFPIHSGEAFGGLGRPIALLVGLSPFILYMTGLARWLQKRRTRKRSAFP